MTTDDYDHVGQYVSGRLPNEPLWRSSKQKVQTSESWMSKI